MAIKKFWQEKVYNGKQKEFFDLEIDLDIPAPSAPTRVPIKDAIKRIKDLIIGKKYQSFYYTKGQYHKSFIYEICSLPYVGKEGLIIDVIRLSDSTEPTKDYIYLADYSVISYAIHSWSRNYLSPID